VSSPPLKLVRTRISEPGKSTSRQRSAISSPPPQPGECSGQVDGGVLIRGGGPDERHDLLGGEHLQVSCRTLSVPLNARDRVCREPPNLRRSSHHAVRDHEQLVLRPWGERRQAGARLVDRRGGDVLQRQVAETGEE
jgi:hypothetical protein